MCRVTSSQHIQPKTLFELYASNMNTATIEGNYLCASLVEVSKNKKKKTLKHKNKHQSMLHPNYFGLLQSQKNSRGLIKSYVIITKSKENKEIIPQIVSVEFIEDSAHYVGCMKTNSVNVTHYNHMEPSYTFKLHIRSHKVRIATRFKAKHLKKFIIV